MDALAFLDVAIGLILIYLVLSLIATSLGEVITKKFRWRSTFLREAVRSFMCESATLDPLTQQIFKHPEIEALRDKRGDQKFDPDYIETEAFARMVLELVLGDDWRKIGSMPDVQRRRIQRFVVNPTAGLADDDTVREQARQSREHLARILIPQVDQTGGDIEKLQKVLQNRYKQVTLRATGWFKWKISKAMVLIGFLLALATNADTLRILENLSDDPALRATAVSIATEHAGRDNVQPEVVDGEEAASAIKIAKKELGVIAPLIGWTCLDPVGRWICSDSALEDAYGSSPPTIGKSDLWLQVPMKLLGFMMTAFAISLGAPFWFDLLQKIIEVRSSIKPKEEGEDKGKSQAAGEQTTSTEGAAGASGTAVAASLAGAYSAGLTGFMPSSHDYQPMNNLWLIRCAALAYEDPEEIKVTCKSWGLESVFISSPNRGQGKIQGAFKSGSQAFIAWNDEIAIVSFRGTETKEIHDAVTDVDFKLVEPNWIRDPADVLVHRGFRNALDDIWLPIWDRIQSLDEQSIWVTGHSLGGALAMLAGYRLSDRIARHNRKIRDEIRQTEVIDGLDKATVKGRKLLLAEQLIGRIAGVHTAGQPRCGNEAFVKEVERRIGPRIYRTINNRDIVPRIPLRAMDYHHAGAVRYIDESGRIHADPGLWYRLLDTLVISPDDLKVSAGETIKDHSADLYVGLLQNDIKSST